MQPPRFNYPGIELGCAHHVTTCYSSNVSNRRRDCDICARLPGARLVHSSLSSAVSGERTNFTLHSTHSPHLVALIQSADTRQVAMEKRRLHSTQLTAADETRSLSNKKARIRSSFAVRDATVPLTLWADKFAPKNQTEVVGNSTSISALTQWLRTWGRGSTGSKGSSQNSSRRAALVSGPPGIGKTTSTALVCRDLGFRILSVNASDSRGKSGSICDGVAGSLSSRIREYVTNKNLSFQSTSKKSVLIMDEVDGMSAGDRGGVSELIELIKITKIPIICIANDRYSPKLKALSSHCLDLPYQRPNKVQVRKYLESIAASEGLDISQEVVEALVESNNNDVRSCLNQLQMQSLIDEQHPSTNASKKDVALSVFQAADAMLRANPRTALESKLNMSFQHGDLLPFFVQENYLNMRPSACPGEVERLNVIAVSAARLSEGDVFNQSLNSSQNWSLLPMCSILSCVLPATAMSGLREPMQQGERNFHRFPGILGKLATKGKNSRLLTEMYVHVRESGHCMATKSSFRMDHAHLMKQYLTRPLFNETKGGQGLRGISHVTSFMKSYGLTRDDWANIQQITTLSGRGPVFISPTSDITTAVKMAFTKTCKVDLA